MSRSRLIAESIAAQRAINRAMWDATLDDLIELDITMAQLKALAAVQRQPNCTIGMLSERLGIKPPATSLLVDKLVAAGLARRERDALDGRRVIVHTTARGMRFLSRIRQGTRSVLQKWLQQLSDNDLAAVHSGTRALAEAAAGFAWHSPVTNRRAREVWATLVSNR